jgi:hypothetical protein
MLIFLLQVVTGLWQLLGLEGQKMTVLAKIHTEPTLCDRAVKSMFDLRTQKPGIGTRFLHPPKRGR